MSPGARGRRASMPSSSRSSRTSAASGTSPASTWTGGVFVGGRAGWRTAGGPSASQRARGPAWPRRGREWDQQPRPRPRSLWSFNSPAVVARRRRRGAFQKGLGLALPPGNSQSPAICRPGGRCASKTRRPCIRHTATTRTTFLGGAAAAVAADLGPGQGCMGRRAATSAAGRPPPSGTGAPARRRCGGGARGRPAAVGQAYIGTLPRLKRLQGSQQLLGLQASRVIYGCWRSVALMG
jgi:hypothetical protein